MWGTPLLPGFQKTSMTRGDARIKTRGVETGSSARHGLRVCFVATLTCWYRVVVCVLEDTHTWKPRSSSLVWLEAEYGTSRPSTNQTAPNAIAWRHDALCDTSLLAGLLTVCPLAVAPVQKGKRNTWHIPACSLWRLATTFWCSHLTAPDGVSSCLEYAVPTRSCHNLQEKLAKWCRRVTFSQSR